MATKAGQPSPSGAQSAGAPSRPDAPTEASKLEDQAANAALYHKGQQPNKFSSENVLDQDNKLSAAGAAASLKYANPKQLPSYPTVGLPNKQSSAGAAASLANARHTQFEHWKPDPSASASAAAVLAKDYKMDQLWHPEHSAEGSKAAILAAKEGAHVNVWRPGNTDNGLSAATQAFRASANLSPKAYDGHTPGGRDKSLRASTLAVSASRRRSGSTPTSAATYPDSARSAYNALYAANTAHHPTPHVPNEAEILDDLPPSLEASRFVNVHGNLPREMYTATPPVPVEQDEKKRAEALHSAAVTMAKQMYHITQKTGGQAPGTAGSVNESGTTHLTNVEEAARKLAAERLAKLYDEHAAYREYYGTNNPAQRASIRGRTRRRAASMGQGSEEDEARSRQIRAEMSIFNKNIEEIDTKKRQKDREALLAVAQKNVRASMHGLDERIFAETGRIPPSMMDQWEAKARATAEADSKARMANYGKVHIGGGKFVDQSDVDAAASRNVQPVLDEIDAKAETHRTKDEERRAKELEREFDRERAKWEAENERERDLEMMAELKRAKKLEKAQRRAKRREEKANRVAERRRLREERRQSTDASRSSSVEDTTTDAMTDTSSESDSDNEAIIARRPAESSTQAPGNQQPATLLVATTTTEVVALRPAPATGQDTSSPKSGSRVGGWLMDKFTRRASKSHKSEDVMPEHTEGHKEGGVGGAVATPAGATPLSESVERTEPAVAAPADVSPPTAAEDASRQARSRQRDSSPAVSPLSIDGDKDYADARAAGEGQDTHKSRLAPPAIPATQRTSDSPVRDSKFVENL